MGGTGSTGPHHIHGRLKSAHTRVCRRLERPCSLYDPHMLPAASLGRALRPAVQGFTAGLCAPPALHFVEARLVMKAVWPHQVGQSRHACAFLQWPSACYGRGQERMHVRCQQTVASGSAVWTGTARTWRPRAPDPDHSGGHVARTAAPASFERQPCPPRFLSRRSADASAPGRGRPGGANLSGSWVKTLGKKILMPGLGNLASGF